MKNGFTLAEVLITLGIIGVVVALTIPQLTTNFRKKETAVRIKKIYSELNQAIKLSEVQNGDFENWAVAENPDNKVEDTKNYVNKYIKPYYKSLKLCGEGMGENNICKAAAVSYASTQYYTNNGVALSFRYISPGYLTILVDLQPQKAEKIMGRNVFYFSTNNYKKTVMPTGWIKNLTREMALSGYNTSGYTYSCKKVKTNDDDMYTDHRHGCTALLMIDGWEFKNDYPW